MGLGGWVGASFLPSQLATYRALSMTAGREKILSLQLQ